MPTSLRTSAVSLLATAADTDALALHAYVPDLLGAMVDLVQVESVQTVQARPKGETETNFAGEGTPSGDSDVGGLKGKGAGREARGRSKGTKSKNRANDDNQISHVPVTASESMDSQPTAVNSKFPPLRRSALHFLALIARSLIARVYDSDSADTDARSVLGLDLSTAALSRVLTVLKYIAATDADDVVRVMAREAAELLEQLRQLLLGVPQY